MCPKQNSFPHFSFALGVSVLKLLLLLRVGLAESGLQMLTMLTHSMFSEKKTLSLKGEFITDKKEFSRRVTVCFHVAKTNLNPSSTDVRGKWKCSFV